MGHCKLKAWGAAKLAEATLRFHVAASRRDWRSLARPATLAALPCLALAFPSGSEAQRAAEGYRARLLVSGYLLRSAVACPGSGSRHTADMALRFAAGGDLRAFSSAFPKRSEAWMKEGAAHFNDDVAEKGITAACAGASGMVKSADRKGL